MLLSRRAINFDVPYPYLFLLVIDALKVSLASLHLERRREPVFLLLENFAPRALSYFPDLRRMRAHRPRSDLSKVLETRISLFEHLFAFCILLAFCDCLYHSSKALSSF